MHLTHLKIENFMGIKAADVAIDRPINLFTGPNEAGKSSIRDAVLYALTGNARGLKNEEARGALIRAGAKAAEITVTWKDNGSGPLAFTRRKTPKSPGAVTGDMPLPADVPLPILMDTRTFFEMSENDRRALLFKVIPGLNPTAADLTARAGAWLKKAGVAPTPEFQFGLKRIVAAAVEGGFKAAESEAVGKRREAKRAAEVNTEYAQAPGSEVNINETIYDLKTEDPGTLAITIKTLTAKRDELLKASGRMEDTEEKLKEVEAALAKAQLSLVVPVDPEAMEEAKKDLALAIGAYGDAAGAHDQAIEAHKKAVEALRALEQPKVADEAFPMVCPAITRLKVECPNAGQVAFAALQTEAVDMAPAEKAEAEALAASVAAYEAKEHAQIVLNAAQAVVDGHLKLDGIRKGQEKEIDRLEAQAKDLRIKALNPHAAENLQRIEGELSEKSRLQLRLIAYLVNVDKAEAARGLVEKCEAEVTFYDVVAKAMAPAGIPTEMIREALAPVNNLLAVAAAHLFPGRTLALNPELNFTLEGAPLVSKSAELRVGVAIQYVLAKLAGARLLMVDEVDMLDPANRAGFLKFLLAVKEDFDCIMAFSTAATAGPAPIPEVQVWWVENGGVVAL